MNDQSNKDTGKEQSRASSNNSTESTKSTKANATPASQKVTADNDTTKSVSTATESVTNGTTSTKTAKVPDSGMSDGVFGLLVLAVLLALVIWAVVSVTASTGADVTLGQLQYPTASRMGDSVSISYEVAEDIDSGSIVEWYIDDVRVHHSQYGGGDMLEYQWTVADIGKHTVQLRIGDSYTEQAVVSVSAPLAVVSIGDYTIQYGEPLPLFEYTVSGTYSGEDIGCSGSVVCSDNIDGVGIYPLTLSDAECTNGNYEYQYNSGNLIVVPRRVNISSTISKQYDGTNVAVVDSLELAGVVEGDDVCATADVLYYSDKHVGTDKQISSYNIELCGKDCANYTLEGAVIEGSILPRQLTLEGTTVAHKVYDGTDRADISNSGSLYGVIEGDSVGIGYIDARYNSAKIGKEKDVTIDNVTLVGSDSGNYTVSPPRIQGRIVGKYIDLLTGNDAVVGDSQQY